LEVTCAAAAKDNEV
jgi:positive regulator of sigma E activity